MAIESNIFEWIGESIDMTLNTFVQVTSGNVISMFTDFFIYGGTLTFVLMGFAIILGYVEAPAANFLKTSGKFLVISGLVLSAPTYMGWVVEALRGLETGVADAFSASGSSTPATSVYQVLDKAVTDGFQIGGDMLDKMGKRRWYEIGMVFWDLLNAIIIYAATLIIAIPAGAMVIVSKMAQSARSCDFGHLGEHVGNGLVVVDDRPCEERRSAPIRERRYEPWRFEWGSDRLLEPEFFGHRVRDRQSGDGTTGIGGSA